MHSFIHNHRWLFFEFTHFASLARHWKFIQPSQRLNGNLRMVLRMNLSWTVHCTSECDDSIVLIVSLIEHDACYALLIKLRCTKPTQWSNIETQCSSKCPNSWAIFRLMILVFIWVVNRLKCSASDFVSNALVIIYYTLEFDWHENEIQCSKQ